MNENRNDLQTSEDPFVVTERSVTIFTKAGDWLFARKARRRSRHDTKKIMTDHRKRQSRPVQFTTDQPSAKPTARDVETITQRVRRHLENGNSITVQECSRLFHTTELRMIISRLRKKMEIRDSWETSNDGKRYKRYSL